MATIDTTDQEALRNPLGAIIFFSYILVALVFTSLILSSLFRSYHVETHREASSGHFTFGALSALSFASLTYHMLFFLITSYRGWALARGIVLPGSPSDLIRGQAQLHIWPWAVSSTLFHDFATELFAPKDARLVWTQSAFVASMGSSVFIAIEGRSYVRCVYQRTMPF